MTTSFPPARPGGGGGTPIPPATIEKDVILAEDVGQGVLLYYTDDAPVGGVSTVGIADIDVAGKFPCVGASKVAGTAGQTIKMVQRGDVTTDTTFFGVGDIISLGNNGLFFESPLGLDQRVGAVRVVGTSGIVDLNIDLNENPAIPVLTDNEMLKYSTTGGYEGTGDINTDLEVNFGTKILRAATGAFDSGSIDMVGYTLNERGGYLQTVSKTTGRTFISLDYEIDNNGTSEPLYDSRGALITRQVKQADDTQTINGLTSYDVTPDVSQDISQIYFNFVNPVTNFRARITSDITGQVISYIPSRSAFDKDEGLSLAAGEQTFSPETVLPELVGFPLTVEVFADQSIDVLGDSLGNPWRAVDVQDIISLQMLSEQDVALESISTSWIAGGAVTQNTATTIDIAAGSGRIVSIDVDGKPVIIPVSWDEQLNVALPDVSTELATRVGIDENGDFVPLGVEQTSAAIRNNIIIASVSHPEGTINLINQDGLKAQEVYSQLIDNLKTLGVTKRGGNGFALTPNANLTFQKGSGELEAAGAGIATGNAGQNIAAIPGESPATFSRVLGLTDDTETASTTLVDPGFYDNGTGTKVAVPLVTNATIQYIYQGISGGVAVMYGQTVYTDVNEAVLNNGVDVVTVPETIRLESNLIGRIIVQADATDLSDSAKVLFLSGVKFGSGLDGGLSGSSGGGGDVIGGVSSTAQEIVRHADASGKVIEAGADVTANAGVLKRITASSGIQIQSSNGISKVEVTPTNVDIVAKNTTDTSTAVLRVSDSNGAGFGGSNTNFDGGLNASTGYKSSSDGTFRNQMYYVANEDATHLSHNGSNSNPNADMVMGNTSITTEFSGTKAMSIDNTGSMDVSGANPEINLDGGGASDFTLDNASGTMRLGRSGFAATDARLQMEFGFTTLRGGDTGYSQLISGSAIVDADGTSGNVDINSNVFGQGDAFAYPTVDGNAGDVITTDAAGNLTLDSNVFDTFSTSGTLEYDNKYIYIDSSAGPFTLTLGDNPRQGEKKVLWMGDNTNEVLLTTANPAFPIDPQTPPAEANIQGMWTLSSDFLDRFSTDRDMGNTGSGGAFVPIVVNGNNVNGFDFQGTAYLESPGYAGILGGSARSVTCWYQATAGEPTTDQNIISWGEDIPNGGGGYWEIEFRSSQGYLWVNNRNAWRRFPYADLNAVNLFDGNAHHIAVTQSTSNMNSVILYIDGVRVAHTAQDTSPGCNTLGGNLLKIGAGYNGNQRLDGILYDVRLFNRGLTLQEVDEIRFENILGDVNLSALNNDMVIDVTYNGSEWKLGVGTESLVGSIDGRLTSLEDSAFRGSGSSTASSIVTYADDTGLQADNNSGVNVIDGLFVKDGVTPNMTFQTPIGGDITLTTDLTEVRLNETTGNIEFTDGGGGFSDNFFGRWRLRNGSDSPGILLHNNADSTIGGMLWDTDDGGYLQTFTGTTPTPVGETRLSDTQYKVTVPSIVNSSEAITAQGLQVNDEFSDPGTVTYYNDVPLMVNLLTNNGGSTPSAPATALSLHRSGVPSEAYGNSARFDLSRYENASTNMRTQMDIRLGHRQPVTTGGNEGENTPTILSMRSNGQVSMPTTTAAFFPPSVTTVQREAIAPNVAAIVYDNEVDAVYTGDGAAWNKLTASSKANGKVNVQNNIAMSGIFQFIQSGTMSYYELNGAAATPNFTNGAWVVDNTGIYQFNVRGWAFGGGSEDQSRFFVSINGNDYVSDPNGGIDTVCKNGSGINLSGSVNLTAGDVVRIGYSVLSGAGWEVDAFSWDFNKVN